jgi:predicted GIY-YIG superfamily endonuclease
MYYVYTVRNKDTNSVLRVGETKDLKRRLATYVTKPCKNKYGNSFSRGHFHGQNIELIVIRECETKNEAKKWEGIFKQFLGFEWTEQTRVIKDGKPVLAFKKDTGDFVSEFESQIEAARQLGVRDGNISKIVRGIAKSAKGYTFKLKEQD